MREALYRVCRWARGSALPGSAFPMLPPSQEAGHGTWPSGRQALTANMGCCWPAVIAAPRGPPERRARKGVVGRVDGDAASLGNVALMGELGVDAGPMLARADELRSEGQTVMFVARDGRLMGLVGVADPIKESAPEALEQLRHAGLTIVMLTGDSRRTAEAVAAKLGITHVEAEVLPERKIEVVRDLRAKGGKVAMAGDGVNDAPALAAADVGIAMG